MWDISTGGLALWEQGKRPPRVKYYPMIIEFLGYVPFDLKADSMASRSKYYRYVNGLRQKDLANIIGVDPGTISRIETGEWKFYDPAKSKIVRFFRELDLT